MKNLSSKNFLLCVLLLSFPLFTGMARQMQLSDLPVRGMAIAAPQKGGVDRFVKFMDDELGPRGLNVLVLRVDYNYAYESHPELRDPEVLSPSDVKKIVAAASRNGIKMIPQINLLGHQSWASSLGNLLKEYPEFDETPHVAIPENYKWPNEDGLYCKSYCPLHPGVHDVVFDLVDEIVTVFEADAFHAGMDEVFYIGDEKCPRCGGRDKAELFAGEVSKIRNHLHAQGKQLWIWGDRLIDGKTTGIGMWEASMNNTHRAIDMIPRDVVICDWHYERPDQTPVMFAMKGFDVISCSWRKPQVGMLQVEDMIRYRTYQTKEMQDRFKGVMLTVWSGADAFLDGFEEYTNDQNQREDGDTEQPWVTFVRVFGEKIP
ncbi:Glycosyl hydrolase family 20, catalytic domain [Cyclobacterium lianum]|uniref:Glycosyl hydrolase family 20, catalytic domain n=1 Tax=Cyclobacterium lianum TaxID=388280 RepID=A0A1M7PW66_9BACT|nr:family 20 glycosylhydrolase [Cyclobacterium lianum]SHN21797.1 Glycosyl hydrolase family 20, catalytic domain [Cyclobacterium lianum]